MLRRFSVNFALLSMLLDGLSVSACLWLASLLRPALNTLAFVKEVESLNTVPSPLYVLLPMVWVLIFAVLSLYDGRKFLRAADEISALFLSTVIASISSAGVMYFSFREVSRALFVLFVICAFMVCFSWRVLARLYFRVKSSNTDATRRILVIGVGPLGQRVGDHIQSEESESTALIGYIDDLENAGRIPQSLGGLDDLTGVIHKHAVTDIVLALPYSTYHKMADIVSKIEKLPVGVWIALGFFDLALYRTNIEEFAGIPMLDLRASAIDDYQRMLKRVFDIVIVFLLLVPALPFMALSAFIIFLEDGSPILFRQKRVGENGRLFEILKFRTMLKNAEQLQSQVEKRDEDGNLIHKTKDDPRITRTGRLLRRFSIDELPQLFNILGGTMSLVGPRPEMPYLVDKYQPWQRKRFAVPPGLTGWWQVNGRSDKPMHLHTEDDLYYIQNYSIWLDIQIIFRTIWVVLIGRGSY